MRGCGLNTPADEIDCWVGFSLYAPAVSVQAWQRYQVAREPQKTTTNKKKKKGFSRDDTKYMTQMLLQLYVVIGWFLRCVVLWRQRLQDDYAARRKQCI